MDEQFGMPISVVEDLKRMGKLAEKAVLRAVDSLIGMDADAARAVVLEDDAIDEMEIDIEQQCMEYLGCDLGEEDGRSILAFLKVTTEFERIADYATDIAETALHLTESGKPVMGPTDHIVKITTLTGAMLKDALKCFFNADTEMAREVILADTAVDEAYEAMYRDQLSYLAKGQGVDRTEDAIDLLLVARYLERIADHATNVAEYCIFMVTGDRVAHQKLAPYPKRVRVQEERPKGLLKRLFNSRND